MLSFKSFLESDEYMDTYALVSCRGSSSGSHGWGDTPESPAGDPKSRVNFEIEIDHKVEPYLAGHTVLLRDNGEGGSYHERWWGGEAVIYLPDELVEKISNAKLRIDWTNINREDKYRKKFIPDFTFKFQNIRHLLAQMASHFKLTPPYYFYSDTHKDPSLPDYLKKLYDSKATHWELPEVPKKPETSEEYWKKKIDKTWLPKPKDQWEGD